MKLQIDHSLNIPLHLQVERLLRLYLDQKKNKGEMFPKEVDIANELGIARNTVRQAISKLVMEGLLVRKKGVGTIIAEKKIFTRLDNWFSFTQEMKEKGLEVVNHILETKKMKAGKEVAEVFKIKPGTSVLCLTRLRGTRDIPYLLSISWFHPRYKIDENEDFSRPLYKIMEEKYNIHVSRSREEISAIATDKFLSDLLRLKKKDPVLFRKRVVYNSDGMIVEYNKVFYHGEGITYSIEINRS